MNSYPPELLVQLAPVMFVAGLDTQSQPPQTPASPAPNTPTTPQSRQDPFYVLATRLRDALVSQRKVAIWQPEKTKTFQVVLVDKVRTLSPRDRARCNNTAGRAISAPQTPPARRPAVQLGPLAALPLDPVVAALPRWPHRADMDPEAYDAGAVCICGVYAHI